MERRKKQAITIILLVGCIVLYVQARAEELRPKTIEYTAEGLEDPFREAVSAPVKRQGPPKPLPALTIQGLIWGASNPQAIVNNKIVKIGDTIEGVRIVSINKSGLTVSFEEQQYNLTSPGALSIQNLQKKTEGGSDEK